VISINELTFSANQVNSMLLTKPFAVFALLAAIYFLLCFSLTQVARHLERRVARRRVGNGRGADDGAPCHCGHRRMRHPTHISSKA
jgi:polar amino acid transport system permease protein